MPTIPVYEWKVRPNPLTAEEAANVEAEADVHERIGTEYYEGVAEGMRDIKKQYSENPVVPFKHNPAPYIVGKIYSRLIEIRASKAGVPHKCDSVCKAAGHRFKHPFKQTACIYAMSDGSLLIK